MNYLYDPAIEDIGVEVYHGDALEVLSGMPDNSVHAVITDPPYGLSNTSPEKVANTLDKWVTGNTDYVPAGRGFMGNAWDRFVPPPALWSEVKRVLKPGGLTLVFAGSRTSDLMGISLRMARFDIRDSISWIRGDGMPKSINLGKIVDKHLGAERPSVGPAQGPTNNNTASRGNYGLTYEKTLPGSPEGELWEGWGTALKPSQEPVIVARKPSEQTNTETLLEHGTGGLNVAATKVEGRHPANTIVDESVSAALEDKAKFFYCSKARREERQIINGVRHPTVKPLSLMRYLIRLVTPIGGVILDPFTGSGTTLEAARLEGFESIGVESHDAYLPLIEERLSK